jgi:adenylosuccinate synthase
MMHLDTLTGLKEIKVCRGYKIDGKETKFFPSNAGKLVKAECVYETVEGWNDDITKVSNFDDLPVNARNYIALIEEAIRKPVTIIGVGPKRSQTIFR